MTVMNSIAHANDHDLSLPQYDSESFTIHFSESAVNWDEVTINEVLQIFVGAIDLCCDGRTPVAGRYALKSNFLTFTPAFSFVAGQDYVARIRIPGMDEDLVPFSLSSVAATIDATVTEIYPSGDTLPENVLRFYIHFSVPMSPHVAFDYIELRDASGVVDEAAFMRFKQELWNEDRTRLTLLIDPGRIKRNVATNVELGPALLAGQHYVLSVASGWPSADGMSVLPAFSKAFTVSDALRERPDVRLWQTTPPCLGTSDPLNITFDRPFDRHLLSKDIRVVTGDGQIVGGIIHVDEGENAWSFTPNEPWAHEDLQVIVTPTLEDVAGNNFRDLLDHVASAEADDVSLTALPINLTDCSR